MKLMSSPEVSWPVATWPLPMPTTARMQAYMVSVMRGPLRIRIFSALNWASRTSRALFWNFFVS